MPLKDLFNRYTNREASEEELKKFSEDLAQGKYDKMVEEDLEQDLEQEFEKTEYNNTPAAWYDHDVQYEKILHKAKTKSLTTKNALLWVAAATIVLLGIFFAYTTTTPAQTPRQNNITFTGKQFLHLPDGSTVLMNEGSELTYTTSFGSAAREVTLKGEAYFDIRYNPAKPFIVKANGITTRVLGTVFNVKQEGGHVSVTVERGLVEVSESASGNVYAKVKPDEQIIVHADRQYETRTVDADTETAWVDQNLILDAVTLEEAALKIGARFHKKISFTDQALRRCTISAIFLNGEGIEHIVSVLAGMAQAEFSITNDEVIIKGGTCN